MESKPSPKRYKSVKEDGSGSPPSPFPRRILSLNGSKTPSRGPRIVETKDGTFTVRPMSQDVRHVNDEIHGSILIPPAVHAILDTAPVQRLGSLHQLGCALMAYPCCTHTRKEHSLGVMKLSGKLAKLIMKNQKQLGLSKMDVLCICIAGLCHDLGHGTYSHAYEAFLVVVRKKESDHPELYKLRNERFKKEFDVDIPPLPEKYAHENTSLMMLDFSLSILGLEIDWENLDKPLKQVGDGLDAERFGLVQDDSEEVIPFTSRDFIFIKECIYGKPLEWPDAPENQKEFVGRDKDKEFLYQIVNNKLNGWDTDRSDYFDRDSNSAKKEGANFGILSREARVARGDCPVPSQCFQCKEKAVPDKEFDMLLSTQSDDSDGLPVPSRFHDFPYSKLPISRAWMYPRLFVRLDDSILGIIENKVADSPRSYPILKKLFKRYRGHDFYKCVGEVEIETVGGAETWAMSEDEIKMDIVNEDAKYDSGDRVLLLQESDFIVEKRELHCGSKENNPVSQMRFYAKSESHKLKNPSDELPVAMEVNEESLPMNTLKSFIKRSIRLYSRDSAKNDFIAIVFESWCEHKQQRLRAPPGCSLKTFALEGEAEDGADSQPALLTQDDDMVVTPAPKKAKRKLGL